MILARIVRFCVPEAAAFLPEDLAKNAIPGKIEVRKYAVYREDAEDPGSVRMEQTEDASISEGTIRYDILFDLTLPYTEPITVIINVEIQNKTDLPYPLEARAMSYGARQLGQQGPAYGDLKKVYSIWIVSNPEAKDRNTVVRYQIKKVVGGGDPEPAGEADLIEAVFLNLGPEQGAEDGKTKIPDVLRMLDTIFSGKLDTEQKKNVLETEFGIPMTKEVVSDLEAMAKLRFGFEAEAEERGEKRGKELGALEMLFSLVKRGLISPEDAAEEMDVSKEQFLKKMSEAEQAAAPK